MSKYIIEIEEKPLCVFDKDTQTYFPRLWRVKGFNSLMLDEEELSRLDELNSDYINEHFSDLQDTAYDKGYAQCQDDYGDALKHAKDTAYQKGFEDGKAQREHDDKIEVGDEVEWDNDFTGDRFIVTRIYQPYGKKEQCDGIDDDGCVYHDVLIKDLEKTGRHFDIQKILEGMK